MATGARTPTPVMPRDRLPRPQGPQRRGSEIRVGLFGLLAILVLVLGIPAALCLLVGYPLPTSAPTRDWLTQQLTESLLLKTLSCVMWIVWAHFTVCLITEWRALRQGRVPTQVALGGGSQFLARRLVAAVLLLAGAATMAPHATHSSPSARPAAVTMAQSDIGASQAHRLDPAALSTTHVAVEATSAKPSATQSSQASKYYVVEPPHGRRYDCLWDIADRTLGDPKRYKEIFALNKDRLQADGRKLVDANLIHPGWELRLPADAKGPGVSAVHSAPPVAPKPLPKPAGQEIAQPAVTSDVTGATGGAVGADNTRTHASDLSGALAGVASHSDGSSMGGIALGGALMLAGVLTALRTRRGPYADASDEEEALQLGADPGLAATLADALRHLARGRAAQGRPLPLPVVAWVSSQHITLSFAGGDTSEPPTPWLRDEETGAWTCNLEGVTFGDVSEIAAPFPGLVAVGRHDTYDVFVDLEQAPGLISVAGDTHQARAALSAIAIQAATALWSDGATVTLVGFADAADLARIDSRAISHVDQLEEVLSDIERKHANLIRLQREIGVDGVLSGRQVRRSAQWQPHLVVLSGPPTPAEAQRLQAIVSGRTPTVALVVGDLPSARWKFVIDASGHLDLGVLGATAQAYTLDTAGVARLGELVASARTAKRETISRLSGQTPAQVVESRLSTRSDTPTVATVRLLGPVQVEAQGPVDPAKRDQLTEIVVAVALHDEGLHEAVLRASLWPRGVSDEVFAAQMADAAAWLGDDPSGAGGLHNSGGRWRLSDAVGVDWDDFRRLAAAPVDGNELDGLLQALALVRGRAFSGAPAGHYAWLAYPRAARDARAAGTAVARRAAALLVDSQRFDQAADVLRRGLTLVPEAELLWRDLLLLASRRGPDDAAAVAAEMYAALAALGAWPEPETDALVAHLAPSHNEERTG